MQIGIIGSGNVGGTLATAWAGRGHQVMLGARDAQSDRIRKITGQPGLYIQVGSIAEAVRFADAVVLAVPWRGANSAIDAAGDLAGKILLDCTNPLKTDLSGLEINGNTSGGEQVAAWARGAQVVKIFNTTGSANMANPNYGGQAVTMFYCGDHASANAVAAQLAAEIGFDPVFAGPLSSSRLLEPLALLWVRLAYPLGMGSGIAFKLMRR